MFQILYSFHLQMGASVTAVAPLVPDAVYVVEARATSWTPESRAATWDVEQKNTRD